MADLDSRTQDALNESRILVLGVQVILSFQYSSFLESSFDRMPYSSRYIEVIALGLLIVAFGLFVAPAPNHLLIWSDEESPSLQKFVTIATAIALVPFATAMALDVYVTTERVGHLVLAVILGAATFSCAMFFWYGLEAIHVRTRGHQRRSQLRNKSMPKKKHDTPSVEDQIQHALTDARVVLPGAQALLGFQFVGVFLGGFEELPASSQYIHVVSLTLVTLSTILLMMPAAYHRLVEQGQPSEHFLRLTRKAVVSSMIPLGAGICGDFFIVARKVTGSMVIAVATSLLLLAMFYMLWFGFRLIRSGNRKNVLELGSSNY
ncbi:DUF6328 family protein [Candidatus Binatus sp.]|uniref:DUF6328 family protein n=1 Tax=Candidatus Binatus sp. TaxID=2811406 RepID=UPI003CC6BDC7